MFQLSESCSRTPDNFWCRLLIKNVIKIPPALLKMKNFDGQI